MAHRRHMTGRSGRERFYLAVSVMYILVGLLISVRSLLAHVYLVALFGVVFIALGVVRLRDYWAFYKKPAP